MLGYCTNVHRGNTFHDVLENIRTICMPICQQNSIDVGTGLWLSNQASLEVNIPQLKDTLLECNVEVFTLNGFPYGDFHSKIVGHDVYEPNWSHPDRLEYTMRLATILAEIVRGTEAGISTVPLGWNAAFFKNKDAARMLQKCVKQLAELEGNTGVCIHIDIETEPGCRLQRSEEFAVFINTYFDGDEQARKHLRVCHDTCHGAVMHESAEEACSNYKQAGLIIGKVQLSSAIEVEITNENNTACVRDLRLIAEPKYLHQTTVMDNHCLTFYENLSEISFDNPSGLWRVHFHVPIHLESIGALGTTQKTLKEDIVVLLGEGVTDWEVETYTWDVVPTELRIGELVDSISKELSWAASQLYT
jgi:hypothetical protein